MDTAVTFASAITSVIGWVPDVFQFFMQAPAVYFVAAAMVATLASLARRFVPMKKR